MGNFLGMCGTPSTQPEQHLDAVATQTPAPTNQSMETTAAGNTRREMRQRPAVEALARKYQEATHAVLPPLLPKTQQDNSSKSGPAGHSSTDISPTIEDTQSMKKALDTDGLSLLETKQADKPEALHELHMCSAAELGAGLKITGFLGRGGYSIVFQGTWGSAPVAVKMVASDSLDAKSASLREALISTAVSHPNVVQTYFTRVAHFTEAFYQELVTVAKQAAASRTDSPEPVLMHSGEGFGSPDISINGSVGIAPYLLNCSPGIGQFITLIAMEYCDQSCLHVAIQTGIFDPNSKWGPRISLRALLRTAQEIAGGMEHLHSKGIVHGDLKPGNVLLKGSRADRRGFISKVTDFGLSRICAGEDPVSASSWGTLVYMAPEHLNGSITKSADVYSFGMLLWEMVSGQKPYKGLTQGQIVSGVKTGGVRPQWPAHTLPALRQLGEECLQFTGSMRPTFADIYRRLVALEENLREQLRSNSGNSSAPAGGDRGSTLAAIASRNAFVSKAPAVDIANPP